MGLLCGGSVTVADGETPVLTGADARAWSAWLSDQGRQSEGVWLVLAKKGTTTPTTLTYEEALEEALCHGWVDGQLAKGGRAHIPAKVHAATLEWRVVETERGDRHSAHRGGSDARTGLAVVEQAKADGRWDRAHATQATMEVPSDLAAALKATPQANAMCHSGGPAANPLPNSRTRRATLPWRALRSIDKAPRKTPEKKHPRNLASPPAGQT